MEMDLLYINVIEQNRGWGAEWFINQGLLRNDVVTHNIDFRENKYQLVDKIEMIRDFDAVLLQRGDNFPLEILRSINRPMVFWASELVSRCRDQDRLLKSGLFEHVFVHTQACLRTVLANGWLEAERVSVLLNGFDPATHRPCPDIEKDIDVLFYGTVTPRRQNILDRLRKEHHIHHVQWLGDEMTEVVNRSKILLNIHAGDFLDTETRIFEGLGWGSFILSEELSEDNPFVPGQHYAEVKSVEDMTNAIDYYLENEDERDRIASQGHAEAMAKHTYDERAREISEVIRSYSGSPNGPAVDTLRLRRYRPKETALRAMGRVERGLQRLKGRRLV